MKLTRIILFSNPDDKESGLLLDSWIPFNEKYFVKDPTLSILDSLNRNYEICRNQSLSAIEELELKLNLDKFLSEEGLNPHHFKQVDKQEHEN